MTNNYHVYNFLKTFIKVPKLSHLKVLLDHEITLKMLEFVLNSIEKVKPGF